MMSSASPRRPSSVPDDPVGADALATGQYPASTDDRWGGAKERETVLPPPVSRAGTSPVPRPLEERDEALRWLDEALAEEMEIDFDDLDDDRLTPARTNVRPEFIDTAIVPKRR